MKNDVKKSLDEELYLLFSDSLQVNELTQLFNLVE